MFARLSLIVIVCIPVVGFCETAQAQTGACCIGGSCLIDTQPNCVGGGGVYAGDNTDCAGSGVGGGTDCNANGIIDTCDIANCLPGDPACADCNANGLPDSCDIASCLPGDPTCADCNGNGIPDSCDIANCLPGDPNCDDCNANGIPDSCDIANCPPGDPNCDDCNANMIPDSCDIANCPPGDPNCDDCNSNLIPDSCDIANCPPGDPDCDDCNANSIPDFCDININMMSNDCNLDSIPDECEIETNSSAPNFPFYCMTGCDPDCNNNGIPDACDISTGSSLDLDMDGVPDECIFWTGGGDGLNWDDPLNWSPATVPDNVGLDTFSVVIDTLLTGANINISLNIDATIDTMKLLDAAPQTAIVTFTAGNLTMASVNGIVDEGQITINDLHSLLADASFRITGGGKITLGGPAAFISSTIPMAGKRITSKITIDGQGIIDTDFTNDSPNTVNANVPGGNIVIGGGSVINNGTMSGTVGGTLTINTDISETPGGVSSFIAQGGNVVIGSDGDDPRTVDGCGPIESLPGSVANFTLSKSSLIGFNRWTIGNSLPPDPGVVEATITVRNLASGTVAGPIQVNRNGRLFVDRSTVAATNALVVDTGRLDIAGVAPVSEMTLTGPYSFTGIDETLINWGPGSVLRMQGGQITCNPPGGNVTIEAGGMDLGPGMFANNFNLAVLEIAAGGNVVLVDAVDNGNRNPPGFAEAVYADALILGTDAELFLNGLNLYVGGLLVQPGPFQNGNVIELEACCLPSGACTMDLAVCCTAAGGTPQGIGSMCTPPRACCLPTVGCVMLDPLCCTAQGGVDLGVGAVCAPTEACCVPVGQCFDLDPACCMLIGGTSIGPGSVCQGNVCGGAISVPAVSRPGRFLLIAIILVAGCLVVRRGRAWG